MSRPEPPALSIVIPTRDRPMGVRRAVESALGQSRHDLEVIVVDDGSEERVSLPAHDRLRCVRHAASAGPAGARNAGLRAARGRWIAFLDDDDRLLADMAADMSAWAALQSRAIASGTILGDKEHLDCG